MFMYACIVTTIFLAAFHGVLLAILFMMFLFEHPGAAILAVIEMRSVKLYLDTWVKKTLTYTIHHTIVLECPILCLFSKIYSDLFSLFTVKYNTIATLLMLLICYLIQ